MEAMLNIKETAEYLNCSEKTVRNLIDRGELKAYKVGNRWRIKKEDLEEYLKTNK